MGAMARETGRGSTPGRGRKGAVPPPGGAVGLGERAWRGRCGSGGRRLRGPPGSLVLPGQLLAPGGGVVGRSGAPEPLHKQAPDAEPPGSAGGGAGRGGGRAAW